MRSNMVKYQFSNVSYGEQCIGLFSGDPLPTQFSMIKTGKTPVTIYLFTIQTVSDEGVTISNPMDGTTAIIQLPLINRIKTIVSGIIVELIKSEPVTKEEIVKYFMETDEPALHLFNDDVPHTFTSMTLTKGMVILTDTDDKHINILELTKQSIIKLGK